MYVGTIKSLSKILTIDEPIINRTQNELRQVSNYALPVYASTRVSGQIYLYQQYIYNNGTIVNTWHERRFLTQRGGFSINVTISPESCRFSSGLIINQTSGNYIEGMRVDNHSDYYQYRNRASYRIFRIISGRTGIIQRNVSYAYTPGNNLNYPARVNTCAKDLRHGLVGGNIPGFSTFINRVETVSNTALGDANYRSYINYARVTIKPNCEFFSRVYTFCQHGCDKGRCLTPAESLERGLNYA